MSKKRRREASSSDASATSSLSPKQARRRSTEMMDEFRREAETKALELVETFFPKKVVELSKAYAERAVFNLPADKVVGTLPTQETVTKQAATQAARTTKAGSVPGSRKDYLSSASENESEDDGSKSPQELPDPSQEQSILTPIPSNPVIQEMAEFLKIEVEEGVQALSAVKLWIQLLVPRIEDGNNFGVEVQDEVSAEVDRNESFCLSLMRTTARYFRDRGKIAENFARHPGVEDFRQALIERDQLEYFTLRLFLQDLRDNYATLHDLIKKNLEKIIAPKGQVEGDAGMMMMMM